MKKNKCKVLIGFMALLMVALCPLAATTVRADENNGWQTVDNKTYYNKGGKHQTGRQKIGGKWYFFRSSGVMATNDVKEKKITYFINKNSNLEAYKKGKNYFKPNGKKMNKVLKDDYITLRRARSIVNRITNKGMTKEQKLKKCFDYIIKLPYKRHRMPFPAKNKAWVSLYANDHLVRRGGDCHADAAAFAYLARACGCKNVYVCLDAKLKNPVHHAWTLADGKYYDPLFAQSKNYNRYWAATTYPLRAVVKKKVASGYVGDK